MPIRPASSLAPFVRGAAWLSGLAIVAVLCGCATVVRPPDEPAEPASVFLLDHSGHASLLLPDGEGGGVLYSYGDWRWYALDRKNLFTGIAALCWPTRAALGRQNLPSVSGMFSVSNALRMELDEAYEIAVGAGKAAELQSRLEKLYRENVRTLVFNVNRGLHLVEHPDPYTGRHNSNRVVTDWLEELGCTVRRGCTLFGQWKVRERAAPDGSR